MPQSGRYSSVVMPLAVTMFRTSWVRTPSIWAALTTHSAVMCASSFGRGDRPSGDAAYRRGSLRSSDRGSICRHGIPYNGHAPAGRFLNPGAANSRSGGPVFGRDRRDFLKVLGAGAVAAGMPPWAFAREIHVDQEPPPAVKDPRYREWSAAALAEAKRLGCSLCRHPLHAQSLAVADTAQRPDLDAGGGFGGGGFGGRGGGGTVETYGFGVRVIHSGVWGFASSPVVTPDEIKPHRGLSPPTSPAPARSRRRPTSGSRRSRSTTSSGRCRSRRIPWTVPLEEKVELLRGVTDGDSEDPGRAVRATRPPASSTSGRSSPPARARTSNRSSTSATATPPRRRAPVTQVEDAQLRAAGRRGLRVPGRSAICRVRPTASPPRRSSTRRRSRSARASRI